MSGSDKCIVSSAIQKLPFNIMVPSKDYSEERYITAVISVHANAGQELMAPWRDGFVEILQRDRENTGIITLKENMIDYRETFKASSVRVDFECAFFVEKTEPGLKQKRLVKYNCVCSAELPSADEQPQVNFKIEAPAIAADVVSHQASPSGLLSQSSAI